MSIQKQFKEAILKNNLISRRDCILVGVSGGPDSVALLSLLNSIKKEFRLNLVIGHLDHGLRKESVKDRESVFELGRRFKISVICEKANLWGQRPKGAAIGSLEEIARFARLDFFRRICKEFKLDKVALGHNMDDQAETVLMRLLRGSGLLGLAAIEPKRIINGLNLIRPLIDIQRKEIEKYLKARGLKPVIDKTNLKDVFFRNKIRNRLMPELAKYNPNIKELLANTARQVGSDYGFLLTAAEKSLRSLLINRKRNRIKLDLKRLSRMHPAIFRMSLRLAYKSIKGDMRRLGFKHIKELEALVFHRPAGSIVDLPGNISARKEKKLLSIYCSKG